MCSCLRGVSRWFTPVACGPGSPELSKSYMDMASKLFTFTFTFTYQRAGTQHLKLFTIAKRIYVYVHATAVENLYTGTTACM